MIRWTPVAIPRWSIAAFAVIYLLPELIIKLFALLDIFAKYPSIPLGKLLWVELKTGTALGNAARAGSPFDTSRNALANLRN